MTNSQDPFATPSSSQPEQPLSPGMLPGASAPAPQPQHHLEISAGGPPSTLAVWAMALTGAYTLVTLLSTFGVEDAVQQQKDLLTSDEVPSLADSFGGGGILGLLSFPLLVASFVLLGMWMFKTRTWRTDRGETVTGPPAVEWWGWFVPLAWFVLPYLGMRGITRGHVGVGLLLGWWLPYCLHWVFSSASGVPGILAVDFTTGEVTNLDALDALVPLAWATNISLLVAWVFLALVIRTASTSMKRAA